MFFQSVALNIFIAIFSGTLTPFLNENSHQMALGLLTTAIIISTQTSWKKVCTYVAIFSIAFIHALHIQSSTPSTHNAATQLHDTVKVTEPQFSPHQTTVTVTDSMERQWRLRIPKNTHHTFQYGDRYWVKATIRPGKQATNPGQFNEQFYFQSHGISGRLLPKQIQLKSRQHTWDIQRIQYAIKAQIIHYHQTLLPYPFSDILTGLIFGEHGTRIPYTLKSLFKKAGLIHLLVVSGSQVSLIVGILFSFLRYFRCHRLTILITILGTTILFYGITGGGPSILRAILMALIVLGFKLYHYRSSMAHVLLNVASIMILFNPLILFDLGAYLSFLATIAMIYGVPWIETKLPNTWPRMIRLLIAVTMAPFIITFPFLWTIMYKVSLISILTNLVLVPIIELLVILGFFTTTVGVIFPVLTQPIMNGMFVLLKGMIWFIDTVSATPWSELVLGHISFIYIMGIYGLMAVILSQLSRAIKQRCIGVFMIVVIIFSAIQYVTPNPLQLTFLDVGQGDAIVIILPNKKTLLIDTGSGKYTDAGQDVIVPYLTYHGITHIDAVLLTHYDYDHYGGLQSLAKDISIHTIIDNGNPIGRHKISPWIPPNTTFTTIQNGDELIMDDSVKITCLSPHSFQPNQDKNNRSISLLITYHDHHILLTGDLEHWGEHYLMAQTPTRDVDILKLGHHGSNTSTSDTFLDWSTPEIGIISCGRNNQYGHPHPDVIARCQNRQMDLYHTHQQGAITVKTNGDQLRVIPYLEKQPLLRLNYAI